MSEARLAALSGAQSRARELERLKDEARAKYDAAADALSAARAKAAAALDARVAKELAPLKLANALFRTQIERLRPEAAGPMGQDRAEFMVATNPGAPFGALTRIASGGELARFILALKVALADEGSASTLIFDEVDRGVGGAVADAVGERLARLARGRTGFGRDALAASGGARDASFAGVEGDGGGRDGDAGRTSRRRPSGAKKSRACSPAPRSPTRRARRRIS